MGPFLPPTFPLPLQEAVDDALLALQLDARTAVPEIRSLKPEAQALIAQDLSSRCRDLLSQRLDSRAPISDSDAQGLLATGEALIRIEAGQLSGHLLLVDMLTAMGTQQPGVGTGVCPSSSQPRGLFCKTGERS